MYIFYLLNLGINYILLIALLIKRPIQSKMATTIEPSHPQEFHHRKPIKLVVIRRGYMVFSPFHLLVEFANGNNSTHKRSYSFKIN